MGKTSAKDIFESFSACLSGISKNKLRQVSFWWPKCKPVISWPTWGRQGHTFNFYSKLAHFEKTYHEVDLGDSYILDTACAEMVKYISKSMKVKNITEPLNNGETIYNYYSVRNDGSSSAKTMDEKELFLIKNAPSGIPKFSIMSLEEV